MTSLISLVTSEPVDGQSLLPWLVTIWARVSWSQELAAFLFKKKKKKSSWGEGKKPKPTFLALFFHFLNKYL